MSIKAAIPFLRGQTSGAAAVTDHLHIEGMEIECDDIDYGTGGAVNPKRNGVSNRRTRLRACRNLTGVTVQAKLLAVLSCNTKTNYTIAGTAGAPAPLGGVAGTTRFRELSRLGVAATQPSARCHPIDEFLTSAGCVANDICWLVLRGPAICKTSLANMAADIVVGDSLVAVTATTAAATDATTGGRLVPLDLAVTTNPYVTERIIGLALTALLTNTTNTDILVDVGGNMMRG